MNFSAIVSPDFFPEKKERKEKHSRMETDDNSLVETCRRRSRIILGARACAKGREREKEWEKNGSEG